MYTYITKKHYLILSLIVLTAIFLPLIHTNAFRYTFIEPKFALYDIVTSLISLYYFYYKKEFRLTLLSFLSFIIMFFMLLSIFQSANIVYSFELIFRFFNLIIFTALIYDFLKRKIISIEQIGNFFTLVAFIFSLYYFYGTKNHPIFTNNTSFSPIGFINYTAHVLNIWIPILLLNFFIQKNKFFKYSSLILMVFLIDMLVLSAARASILGLLLAEIFMILLLLIKHRKMKFYPIIGLVFFSLYFLHNYLEPKSINNITEKINRVDISEVISIQTTKSNNQKSNSQKDFFNYQNLNKLSSYRLNVYNNTWDMILDNSWGVGAGNYEYLHPKYAKTGTAFRTPYVNEKQVWTNPHNIILKIASELGWLGGLLFVIIFTLLIKMAISTVLKGERMDAIIAIGIGATLFNSMLSAVFLTPVQLFFVAFLFAILLYRYHTLVSSKTLFTLNKIYGKSLLIIIPLFFIFFHLSKYYNNQFTTQRNYVYLEKALMLNPYNDKAIVKQAQFSAYAKHDYPLAIHYLQKYLMLYPYNISAHIKKANFEYRLKRYPDALKTIEHLLSFDKKNKKMLDLKRRILTIRKNL